MAADTARASARPDEEEEEIEEILMEPPPQEEAPTQRTDAPAATAGATATEEAGGASGERREEAPQEPTVAGAGGERTPSPQRALGAGENTGAHASPQRAADDGGQGSGLASPRAAPEAAGELGQGAPNAPPSTEPSGGAAASPRQGALGASSSVEVSAPADGVGTLALRELRRRAVRRRAVLGLAQRSLDELEAQLAEEENARAAERARLAEAWALLYERVELCRRHDASAQAAWEEALKFAKETR